MTARWPFRLRHDRGAPEVEWLVADGQPLREPFFEHTANRLTWENPANRRSRRLRTPLESLREIPPGLVPSAFIFHVSRCGSTLVAQMLAALPQHRVFSEPPLIDDILQTHRRNPSVSDEDRIAWLRGAVHALGAREPGIDRLFIKLDCWHLFSLPLIARAFPDVPRLFIFRDPVEVLVSLQRRPSLTLLPETVTDNQLQLSAAERARLNPTEHAGAVLGALYRSAWEQRAELLGVSYGQLPRFVWEALPRCPFTAAEQEQLRTAAERDAKNPSAPFVPDSADKRRAASPALQEAAARWAGPHYARWLAAIEGQPIAQVAR
jgi:hypothetical protein